MRLICVLLPLCVYSVSGSGECVSSGFPSGWFSNGWDYYSWINMLLRVCEKSGDEKKEAFVQVMALPLTLPFKSDKSPSKVQFYTVSYKFPNLDWTSQGDYFCSETGKVSLKIFKARDYPFELEKSENENEYIVHGFYSICSIENIVHSKTLGKLPVSYKYDNEAKLRYKLEFVTVDLRKDQPVPRECVVTVTNFKFEHFNGPNKYEVERLFGYREEETAKVFYSTIKDNLETVVRGAMLQEWAKTIPTEGNWICLSHDLAHEARSFKVELKDRNKYGETCGSV